MAIDMGFRFELPRVVQLAIDEYRRQNDWLGLFLSERCELGSGFRVKSGDLYRAYRTFCMDSNEYTRSTSDFYKALESEGFARVRTREANLITGLRLRDQEFEAENGDFPDFLN